ncbi:hypothetical protein JCM30237_11260 [Halolamina litorea]|uniref:Lipoprotein n=1 Tax=Halolamina litorea TaxID=1515593 RepID=A0ABD6BLN9_9EURY|nr:hypothetical protein [Halolamina litorea]
MKRRSLLGTLGVAGVAGLAGCQGLPRLGASTTLGRLTVSNWDERESHRFGLRVDRDGETVHESTHTVESKSDDVLPGAVADCTWDPQDGEYVVAARVDGGEWQRFDLLDRVDSSPDCLTAAVDYRPDGPAEESFSVRVRADCAEFEGSVGSCGTDSAAQ